MTEHLTDRERALSRQIDEQGGQLAAWRDRAIAAEAELARLRAVEPIAYAQNPKADFWCWCEADEDGAIPVYAAPPAQPADTILLPTNAHEAEAMMRASSHWLQDNAPDVLRTMLPAQPAEPVQRLSDAIGRALADYMGENSDRGIFHADPFNSFEIDAIAEHVCRAIESALQPGWRDIESAPKDGAEILMTNGVDVSSGQWFAADNGTYDRDGAPNGDESDAGWMDWSGGMQPDPTHWMPLPPAPKATK